MKNDKIQQIIGFLKRGGEAADPRELEAKLSQAKRDLERIKLEHEEHLNTVRAERDDLQNEINSLNFWMESVTTAIDRDVPSILEQTHWQAGFYNFGRQKQPDIRYFNCGIIEREGVDWLVTRRARTKPGRWHDWRGGINDLVAFKLENNAPVLAQAIPFPRRYKDEHYEDPRVMWLNNRPFVSATTFQIQPDKRWTGAHQIVSEFGRSWEVVRTKDPVFGRNGASLYMQKGNEKNWIWFTCENRIFCVYLTFPHQVVEWNPFFEVLNVHETRFLNPLWRHGEPRGGTPPVRVGDEYFSFFHSSTPWIAQKRRYHMGAYAFEAKPPFRITRMSTLPLLSGSKNDPWSEGLPLVVFPCGALLRNGEWLVTMGINDCESAWIRIPHDELCDTLRKTTEIKHEVAQQIAEKIPTDERDSAVPAPDAGEGADIEGLAERPGGAENRHGPAGE